MEDMFRKYAPMVFRYLKGLCSDDDLAEELMQETFYQAVRSIDRYDGSCKPSTWLCQIAKHLWLRELQRRKRMTSDELTDDDLSIEKQVASAENQMTEREEMLRLLRHVHSLSAEAREVVLLRINSDLSFREIGESIMGRNESWARVTFFRSRQKLKEMMDDEDTM